MADIQPEKEPFRPDVAQDKKITRWAIVLPAAALGALAIGLVAFNALYGRPNYPVGLYDTSRPGMTVTYQDHQFVPSGPTVKIDDDRMVAVNYTDQGKMVYTTKAHLEGGGGGRPETGAEPTDYSNLYLRTAAGTYQPLIQKK